MMFKTVILTLIITFFLRSDLLAGIYGRVEIGMPIGDSVYHTEYGSVQDYSNTYFTELSIGYKNYLFNRIEYRIYAGIFTWSEIGKNYCSGHPFEDIYGFGTKLSYKGIYIRYNHFCAHPVISSCSNKHNNFIPAKRSWMSQMTSLGIGYEFEL